MKKTIYLLAAIVAVLLSSGSVHATSHVYIKNLPQTPIQRSINPITVLNNTVDKVELLFNATLGQVDIEVYDESGAAVYADNIQAAAGGIYNIPVAGWELGTYALTVVANGKAYTWVLELTEE